MVGLPGMKVIPDGWAAAHRPVAAGAMTSECTIRRATLGPPPYPLPEGWDGAEIIWTGRCRVQELKRENSPFSGQQPSELRQYLNAFPFHNDAGVALPPLRTGESGDTVHVLGRVFNLKQSMTGSELWQNDFIAWENQTQQNP